VKRALTIWLACLLASQSPATARAEREVVLVTGKECPIHEISPLDIRKAYLGVALTLEGYTVRALRLNEDERLSQVFFQSIVAMSEKTYERRLLLLLLKYGTPRPLEFASADDLAGALERYECSIGYMWRSDATRFENLTIRNLLWQGD